MLQMVRSRHQNASVEVGDSSIRANKLAQGISLVSRKAKKIHHRCMSTMWSEVLNIVDH
jgi:hypothetical protein